MRASVLRYFRRAKGADETEIRFGSRQIYILPTGPGMLFGLVLLALLLAAVNYSNALAYLLTFLLASLAIVSILHTQRNLLGLHVSPASAGAVFAGDMAMFRVCLRNDSRLRRRGVRVETGTDKVVPIVDIPEQDVRCVNLTLAAPRRGWLSCPPFLLATHFPLGLMRAWTRLIRSPVRVLVYPRPAEHSELVLSGAAETEGTKGARIEGEDFAGLNRYQAGDAASRISWKTLARGQGLHTKDFSTEAAQSLWLEWEDFAPHDTETRLQLLCRALLDAEAAGRMYGLRLPGFSAAPDCGEVHRHRCLEALALYEEAAPH